MQLATETEILFSNDDLAYLKKVVDKLENDLKQIYGEQKVIDLTLNAETGVYELVNVSQADIISSEYAQLRNVMDAARYNITSAAINNEAFKIKNALNNLSTNNTLKSFVSDLNVSSSLVNFYKGVNSVVQFENNIKSWDILNRNHRLDLKKNPDAIGALTNLLGNPILAGKLPGMSTTEIENLLGKMKGWGQSGSGVSYKQVCEKVNELIDNLPNATSNLNNWTNRHAWVQLERLLQTQNKTIISGPDEIIFENPVSSTFGNSVTDLTIFYNGIRFEIETKAGLEFFESLAYSNGNFPTQSVNSLLNVLSIKNYKVFLNPEKIATLSNADKIKVVNAWRDAPGDILEHPYIRNLFVEYWNDVTEILNGTELENLLKNRDDWFCEIFVNNIEQ